MSNSGSQKLYEEPTHFYTFQQGKQRTSFNVKPTYQKGIMTIKWREVMKIDLDYIQNTGDFSILESYLSNLIYSSVSEDEIQSVPEGNIAKLIKIYQFTIEYLLSTQQKLEDNQKLLSDQNVQFENEIANKNATIEDNKNLIRRLKKEKKNSDMVLMTYKSVIENLQRKKKKNPDDSLISSSSTGKYFCKFCTGKKFSTEEQLNGHMRRRHLINELGHPVKEEEKNNNDKIEKKIEDMKIVIEEKLKSLQGNNFMQYLESQKKIEEDKHEKEISEIEKSFKDGLKELKDLYLLGGQYQQPPVQAVNQVVPPSTVNNPDNDEEKNQLKKELERLTQKFERINEENENKIRMITQDFENKIEEIKKKAPPQVNTTKTTHIEKIITAPQAKSSAIQDVGFSMTLKNKKSVFYAGKIESDHDDTDEEEQKEKDFIKKMKKGTESLMKTTELNSEMRKEQIEISFDNENQKESEKKPLLEPVPEPQKPIEEKPVVEELKESKQIEKKPSIHEIEPKVQPKPKPVPTALNELEAFFAKYTERDNANLERNNLNGYFEEIVPQDFIQDNSKMKSQLGQSLLKTCQLLNQRQFGPDLDELMNEPKEKLIGYIMTAKQKIKEANDNSELLSAYYSSMFQCLDMNKLSEEENKITKLKQINPSIAPKPAFLNSNHDENIPEANNSKSQQRISGKRTPDVGGSDFEEEEL